MNILFCRACASRFAEDSEYDDKCPLCGTVAKVTPTITTLGGEYSNIVICLEQAEEFPSTPEALCRLTELLNEEDEYIRLLINIPTSFWAAIISNMSNRFRDKKVLRRIIKRLKKMQLIPRE